MEEKIKQKLDNLWGDHWQNKTPRDFKTQEELANFERELDYKIWKEAQKELLEKLIKRAESKPYPNHTSVWVFENELKLLLRRTKVD